MLNISQSLNFTVFRSLIIVDILLYVQPDNFLRETPGGTSTFRDYSKRNGLATLCVVLWPLCQSVSQQSACRPPQTTSCLQLSSSSLSREVSGWSRSLLRSFAGDLWLHSFPSLWGLASTPGKPKPYLQQSLTLISDTDLVQGVPCPFVLYC